MLQTERQIENTKCVVLHKSHNFRRFWASGLSKSDSSCEITMTRPSARSRHAIWAELWSKTCKIIDFYGFSSFSKELNLGTIKIGFLMRNYHDQTQREVGACHLSRVMVKNVEKHRFWWFFIIFEGFEHRDYQNRIPHAKLPWPDPARGRGMSSEPS